MFLVYLENYSTRKCVSKIGLPRQFLPATMSMSKLSGNLFTLTVRHFNLHLTCEILIFSLWPNTLWSEAYLTITKHPIPSKSRLTHTSIWSNLINTPRINLTFINTRITFIHIYTYSSSVHYEAISASAFITTRYICTLYTIIKSIRSFASFNLINNRLRRKLELI